MTDPELVKYYQLRAKEYDKLYTRADRQDALHEASEILRKTFAEKNVFEIACGTGYWTEQISQTAKSILATDINDAMLEVAKTKNHGPASVAFQNRNFYDVSANEKHENLFGGFIWSHILLQDLSKFIDTINQQVAPGGTVAFIDNRYVEGSNLPIYETDEQGNTYQLRKLDNGGEHKVLKNFPGEDLIQKILLGKSSDVRFIRLQYYWILTYQTITA